MNKAVKYTFGLIGLYLVVKNGKNFSTAINGAAKGGTSFISTLQGR